MVYIMRNPGRGNTLVQSVVQGEDSIQNSEKERLGALFPMFHHEKFCAIFLAYILILYRINRPDDRKTTEKLNELIGRDFPDIFFRSWPLKPTGIDAFV